MLSVQVKTRAEKGHIYVDHSLIFEMVSKEFIPLSEKNTVTIDETKQLTFQIESVLECFKNSDNIYQYKLVVKHPDIESFFNNSSLVYGIRVKLDYSDYIDSHNEMYNLDKQTWEDGTYKYYI